MCPLNRDPLGIFSPSGSITAWIVFAVIKSPVFAFAALTVFVKTTGMAVSAGIVSAGQVQATMTMLRAPNQRRMEGEEARVRDAIGNNSSRVYPPTDWIAPPTFLSLSLRFHDSFLTEDLFVANFET